MGKHELVMACQSEPHLTAHLIHVLDTLVSRNAMHVSTVHHQWKDKILKSKFEM